MFKNAIKKIAAVGLVFLLCAPCCFASAQKMPPNLFIPKNSGGNRTNRQNIGDFRPFFRAMQQAAQMQSDRPQVQPSALEQFWNEHLVARGIQRLRLFGTEINSANDLGEYIRGHYPMPVRAFRALLDLAIHYLGVQFPNFKHTRDVIADIFKLNDTEANDVVSQVLLNSGLNEKGVKLLMDDFAKK